MTKKKDPSEVMPAGRKTLLTDDLAEKITDLIAEGVKLTDISSQLGVSKRSIHNWVRKNPEFMHLYAYAREERAEEFAEEIYKVATTPILVEVKKIDDKGAVSTVLQDDVQARRLHVDSLKWLAAKYAPKKYGDSIRQEIKLEQKVFDADPIASIYGDIDVAKKGAGDSNN